jgi:predicted ABC-type exoprotein transport system permease subunit
MGKRNGNNQLQEYLNDLKERQDHQYSKGYWAGKVPRFYSNTKSERMSAQVCMLNGGIFLLGAVLVLLPVFIKNELFDWDSGGSFFISGVMGLLGGLNIWAGVKKMRERKKRRGLN